MTYRKAEIIVGQYNRELAEWERRVRERQLPAKSDPLRSPRSVREQLQRLQAEGKTADDEHTARLFAVRYVCV